MTSASFLHFLVLKLPSYSRHSLYFRPCLLPISKLYFLKDHVPRFFFVSCLISAMERLPFLDRLNIPNNFNTTTIRKFCWPFQLIENLLRLFPEWLVWSVAQTGHPIFCHWIIFFQPINNLPEFLSSVRKPIRPFAAHLARCLCRVWGSPFTGLIRMSWEVNHWRRKRVFSSRMARGAYALLWKRLGAKTVRHCPSSCPSARLKCQKAAISLSNTSRLIHQLSSLLCHRGTGLPTRQLIKILFKGGILWKWKWIAK